MSADKSGMNSGGDAQLTSIKKTKEKKKDNRNSLTAALPGVLNLLWQIFSIIINKCFNSFEGRKFA